MESYALLIIWMKYSLRLLRLVNDKLFHIQQILNALFLVVWYDYELWNALLNCRTRDEYGRCDLKKIKIHSFVQDGFYGISRMYVTKLLHWRRAKY